MTSFLKIISAEQMILKDFIQIMRLELHNDPSHRWNVEWCLTVPPGDQRRKQLLGTPAVVAENNKVLFFVSTILWKRFIPPLPKSPTLQ
ncbi:mediator of RNA polymerase II transcription subunit 14-like [Paramuricea clavata]|uniref:Mediator of RNA polymerase II transcription subunit 14-like n=1 Tax=Paramuricea clavata TaxID=317549 RepID=A0A6S7K7G5_PARCT|nr:mediator of RNA polymerase II transcription subunit 14-like [Paramuricea clavata]